MRVLAGLILILVIASAAFLYSRTMPHMTDPAAFQISASTIASDLKSQPSEQAYDLYDRLYEAHATPRNLIKRVSLTVAVLATGAILLFHRGISGLASPPNKWLLIPIGLAAALLTVWGDIQDIEELYGMAILPYWSSADSGTAYSAIFVVLPLTLILIGLNSLFLIGKKFNERAKLRPFDIREQNLFLFIEIVVTVGLIIYAATYLSYCSLISAPLWLYFYGSIMAIRAQGHRQSVGSPTLR